MNLRLIAPVLVMMFGGTVVAAQEACEDLQLHDRDALRGLYYYASLTEAADSGQLPRWTCKALDGRERGAPQIYANTGNTDWNSFAEASLPACNDGATPCLRQISAGDFEEHWHSIVRDFQGNGRYVAVYEPTNGGPAYLTCDSEELDVNVFVELSELRIPVDGEDLLGRIFRPVVWFVEDVSRAVDDLSRDEVETVTLRKTNYLGHTPLPETVTAIRGTRPNRIAQWLASARKLSPFHESCVFDVMVRIADHLAGAEWPNYVVTGHSLGGAVTQYIAGSLGGNGNARDFRAFAFNSYGSDAQADPAILESFQVVGDPVGDIVGVAFFQVQAGRSIRLTPPNDPEWRALGATLHLLSSVRKAICDCMNGKGKLTVNPDW